MCDIESGSRSDDISRQFKKQIIDPLKKGIFWNGNAFWDSVEEGLKGIFLAWKEIKPTEGVLNVIEEDYKLALRTIPESNDLLTP